MSNLERDVAINVHVHKSFPDNRSTLKYQQRQETSVSRQTTFTDTIFATSGHAIPYSGFACVCASVKTKILNN